MTLKSSLKVAEPRALQNIVAKGEQRERKMAQAKGKCSLIYAYYTILREKNLFFRQLNGMT